MRRPRSPARRGAPASPARLMPLFHPRSRPAAFRAEQGGSAARRSERPRLRGVPRSGVCLPRRGGAEEGETRTAGRPFQGRRGAGDAGSRLAGPAARTGTVPLRARRRRSGPLRARPAEAVGERRALSSRARGLRLLGEAPRARAGGGVWRGSAAGTGSTGRGWTAER